VNAAGQRRLTPVLAIVAIVLAAFLVSLLMGVGRGVRWDAAGTPEPLPAARPVAMPPPTMLARFAEVWQRPLFMADRKPVAVAEAGDDTGNIGDLELTGIIVTPGLHMALLRDKSKDSTVRVKEGSALGDGHWTLASLSPRSAVFESGGERRELTLKVAAPDALTKAPQRLGQPPIPGQPPVPPRPQPGADNGVHVERQASSGMMGPSLPRPATTTTARPPQPRQDDDALQRARIEALKQAVQRRRLEQQQRQQQATDLK
jgi:general secretion pathway protein N